MTNLSHDLFLLLISLTRITDRKKIIEIFLEAINKALPEAGLSYQETESGEPAEFALELKSGDGDFGRLLLDPSSEALSGPTTALLRNAAGMLALVLQNRRQAELLADEKKHLQTLVEERTAELLQANEKLRHEIEERNRAEAAVGRSEAKYHHLFENMAQGVVYQDQNGRITELNPAAKLILGLEGDEALGRESVHPEWQAIHPDGSEFPGEEHPSMLALKTGREVKNVVMGVFNPREGRRRWIKVNAAPLFQPGEARPHQVFTTFSDITDITQIEHERDQFFNISEDMLAVASFEGEFLELNPAWTKTLGWKTEQLKKRPWLDFVHPDDHQKTIEAGRLVSDGRRLISFENRYRCRDGSYRWLSWNAVPFPERRMVFAAARDVTQKRKAEDALRESESRYRRLVELSPDAVIVHHQEKIRFINNSGLKMLGAAEPEDLIGRNILDLIHPDFREQVRRRIREDSSPLPGQEQKLIRLDGGVIDVETSGIRINFQGRESVLSVVRDISSRKKAEQEKKNLEEQLRRGQKLEAVGVLAGGIAHDFNNLLMGVSGSASLIEMDLGPGHPHLEHVTRIHQLVKSAADLTGQLLGFARGGKYETKPTDLNLLLDKVADMFGRTGKEVRIVKDYRIPEAVVQADPGQMEQVALNLLLNARQAMPDGGEIRIRTELVGLDEDFCRPHELKPGPYILFSVADDGLGMDEKTKERIFEPFFTTREMGRGVGLGLASAYGIVRNHDGLITVDSRPGQGAVFSIYLPASQASPQTETREASPVEAGLGLILLVDDEEVIRDVGRKMIERLGYRVETASSGREALETYRNRPDEIDLIILDLIMPDQGGGVVLDRLREVNPRAKVLLASGYSLEGEAAHIMARGCNGFIQKPFDLKELSGKIKELLDAD